MCSVLGDSVSSLFLYLEPKDPFGFCVLSLKQGPREPRPSLAESWITTHGMVPSEATEVLVLQQLATTHRCLFQYTLDSPWCAVYVVNHCVWHKAVPKTTSHAHLPLYDPSLARALCSHGTRGFRNSRPCSLHLPNGEGLFLFRHLPFLPDLVQVPPHGRLPCFPGAESTALSWASPAPESCVLISVAWVSPQDRNFWNTSHFASV